MNQTKEAFNSAEGIVIDRLDRRKHEYHLHLAAGASPGIEQLRQFAERNGYKDDRLIGQVRMNSVMAAKSVLCPLYDFHGSDHPETRDEFVSAQDKVSAALHSLPGIVAYFHGEVVQRLHETIPAVADDPDSSSVDVSWERLEVDWHEKTKVWDAHFGLPSKHLTPTFTDAFVERGGLYSIERLRAMEDGTTIPWTVLTIQGINPVKDGEELYWEILESLRKARIRSPQESFSIWSTFEVTTRMERFGNKRIAPPTMMEWKRR